MAVENVPTFHMYEFFEGSERPYTVFADPQGHYIRFMVYEGLGDDVPDEECLTGTIKWDGCSNFQHGICLHFCGRAMAKEFGELLQKLYDVAAELLPEHAENYE